MPIDERLAKKGRGEPRGGLAQQARARAGLAEKDQEALTGAGWSPAKTAELKAGGDDLDSDASKTAEAKGVSAGATRSEHDAIDMAKKFKRRLWNALPIVLRDGRVPNVTMASFHARRTLGRSTPKLSTYLGDIRAHVVVLDEPLRPYFEGQLASEKLDEVKSALDRADAAQEVELKKLPLVTQQLHETKGRVLELVEDLNRLAKTAFDGNAKKIGLFNKDILVRARVEQKKPKEETKQ